jgi:hypothetical protein
MQILATVGVFATNTPRNALKNAESAMILALAMSCPKKSAARRATQSLKPTNASRVGPASIPRRKMTGVVASIW